MKTAARILGPLALALTLLPPVGFMMNLLPDATMKGLMLAGCIVWFLAAPRFMTGGDR
ncbi:MAG: hypothetical protein ACYDC1_12655 [Limisphaerales bacterium]